MLPTRTWKLNGKHSIASNATRYGNFAMEHMINDILKHGGEREISK